MILLEFHNKIIEETILEKFSQLDKEEGKFESVEILIADFDQVTFHISTPDPNAKNILTVSMSIKCWGELRKYGVEDVLNKIYGNYITSPESGYDVTLQVDLASPPSDIPKLARDFALLKRNSFAAPFYKVFSDIEAKKGGGPLVELRYRDEEAIFIKTESDRAIVIFSIQFKDPDDVVFAKVFLQEFSDVRRTLTNVPSVLFSQKEPPLELKGAKNLRVDSNQGYVSFVLFAPHMTATKKDKSIDNIQMFRNYLHYHIKCSKAYLHTRMRNKVKSFLQVLNRSKQDQGGEKKTFTGKTFRRADEPQQSTDDDYNI